MANSKADKNITDNEEISKLREVVLRWVELKKDDEKAEPKKTKSKTVKSEIKVPPLIISQSKKTAEAKKTKKGVGIRVIIFLIIIIFLFLVIFGAGLYYCHWQNPATRLVTKIIPYPVAFVDLSPILYYQWQKKVEMMQNFYLKQKNNNSDFVSPPASQVKKNALDQLIDQKLLTDLAKKYNITVSPQEIKQQTQTLSEEIGGDQALEKQLKDLYDWTIADFQKEIIQPLLLKNKIAIAILSDEKINFTARQKAEQILDKIKSGQAEFSDLAKQYSQDINSLQGGELGYFSRGQMDPDFEKAAFALNIGEVSNVVTTQFGYHIIKVEEKLTNDAGEITQIRAKDILIRGKDLTTYLAELKVKSKIWQLVKI